MKSVKFLSVLAAAIVCMLLCPCVSAEVYMKDDADLYSASDEQELIQLMESASDHSGWNYGIVTSTAGYSSLSEARTRAEELYDNAFGSTSSGILFFCDIDYRYLVVAGDANNYVSGLHLDKLLDDIEDFYFDFEDYACAEMLINTTQDYFDSGFSYSSSENINSFYKNEIIMSAVVAFVITAVICILVIVRRYRFYAPPSAGNYLNRQNYSLYIKQDRFIRDRHIRHPKPDPHEHHGGGHHGGGGRSGSRGGGGGHHGGGGRGGRR